MYGFIRQSKRWSLNERLILEFGTLQKVAVRREEEVNRLTTDENDDVETTHSSDYRSCSLLQGD